VYWRKSKRKYRSQLSEQEREDAVNVSTPFQIAKARLSSAYYCNQKRTSITKKFRKCEEERALAQEFKRVYWRESKRKYRSQLSEQEREDAVNVSTLFQIAKARLSSAYFCKQKRTLVLKCWNAYLI